MEATIKKCSRVNIIQFKKNVYTIFAEEKDGTMYEFENIDKNGVNKIKSVHSNFIKVIPMSELEQYYDPEYEYYNAKKKGYQNLVDELKYLFE